MQNVERGLGIAAELIGAQLAGCPGSHFQRPHETAGETMR